MAVPAHKTEYFIIENSNLQKKANTPAKNLALIIPHIPSKASNNADFYLFSRHYIKVTGFAENVYPTV